MFQQLTQTYYSLKVQVDHLAIPSGGTRSVSYTEHHYVDVTSNGNVANGACPNGESVVGVKRKSWSQFVSGVWSTETAITHLKCCKASISV